jgi:hypothetical protein
MSPNPLPNEQRSQGAVPNPGRSGCANNKGAGKARAFVEIPTLKIPGPEAP